MSQVIDRPKAKIGRPTKKTQELLDEICTRIGSGETLTSICREQGKPDYTNVKRWLHADEAFRTAYIRARKSQADAFADRVADISELAMQKPALANAARVAIDGYKWSAAMADTSKYGPKNSEINVSTHVTQVMVSEERQRELQARRLAAETALRLQDNKNETPQNSPRLTSGS